MCETCKKWEWYGRYLAQSFRDNAEFAPKADMSQSERDARRLAAYYIDRIFEDWPGKYVAYPSKNRR